MTSSHELLQHINMCMCFVIISQILPNAGIIEIIFPQILAIFLQVKYVFPSTILDYYVTF
jgi:hypothetical protein